MAVNFRIRFHVTRGGSCAALNIRAERPSTPPHPPLPPSLLFIPSFSLHVCVCVCVWVPRTLGPTVKPL